MVNIRKAGNEMDNRQKEKGRRMDEKLGREIQEALTEWADIRKRETMRIQKDRRIISKYCAQNDRPDILHTLQLLEKYNGMPSHDEDIVLKFKENYPKTLTIEMICDFEDLREIYKEYLENGEGNS